MDKYMYLTLLYFDDVYHLATVKCMNTMHYQNSNLRKC